MAIENSNDPSAFRAFEHDGWQTVGLGYERHFLRLTSQSVSATLDAARVGEGSRLLDVCTGPGVLARAALDRGAQVVGLDFSGKLLEIARRDVPGAKFQQGDAQALPFKSESFDAVVCGYGIIHVPEPQTALSEMHRVLKSAGYIAVSVWEAPRPGNGFGLLFNAIKRYGDLNVHLPHGPDFFQFSEPRKLKAALHDVGFRNAHAGTIQQIWEFDDAQGLMRAILEGAVRVRGLLRAQTADVRNAISSAVIEGMQQHRSSDRVFRVPMPALVGFGRK